MVPQIRKSNYSDKGPIEMMPVFDITKPELKLPVLRTPDGIVKTLDQWREFARRDDCLDRMGPSDLRVILSNFT